MATHDTSTADSLPKGCEVRYNPDGTGFVYYTGERPPDDGFEWKQGRNDPTLWRRAEPWQSPGPKGLKVLDGLSSAPSRELPGHSFALIWRQTLNVHLHDLPTWVEARGHKTERANLYDAGERLSALAIKSNGSLIGPNGDWWSARQIRKALDLSGWSADVVLSWLEDNRWMTVNRTKGKWQRDERSLTIPKGIPTVAAGWPLR